MLKRLRQSLGKRCSVAIRARDEEVGVEQVVTISKHSKDPGRTTKKVRTTLRGQSRSLCGLARTEETSSTDKSAVGEVDDEYDVLACCSTMNAFNSASFPACG